MGLCRILLLLGLAASGVSVFETVKFAWNPLFEAPELPQGWRHTNYHAFGEFTFPTDAEHDRAHARTRLPMPVLAVGGEQSQGGQVEAAVQPLARHVRGLVVERSGHWIAEERPDVVAAELLRFFGEPG